MALGTLQQVSTVTKLWASTETPVCVHMALDTLKQVKVAVARSLPAALAMKELVAVVAHPCARQRCLLAGQRPTATQGFVTNAAGRAAHTGATTHRRPIRILLCTEAAIAPAARTCMGALREGVRVHHLRAPGYLFCCTFAHVITVAVTVGIVCLAAGCP